MPSTVLSPSARAEVTVPVASTWPCTRWPPRRSPRRQRPLQVDRVAGGQDAQGGAAERLGHAVDGEAVRRQVDGGQAGAVDAHRVADREPLAHRRRPQPRSAAPPSAGRISATRPISSTSPVNTALPADGFRRPLAPGPRRRARPRRRPAAARRRAGRHRGRPNAPGASAPPSSIGASTQATRSTRARPDERRRRASRPPSTSRVWTSRRPSSSRAAPTAAAGSAVPRSRDLDAGRAQRGDALGRRPGGGQDQHRDLPGLPGQGRPDRQAGAGVEHDAQRLAHRSPATSRAVSRGSSARAVPMPTATASCRPASGGRARAPRAPRSSGSRPRPWPPCRRAWWRASASRSGRPVTRPGQEGRVELAAGLGLRAARLDDGHPGRGQDPRAVPAPGLQRVEAADHHAGDAGPQHGVGAGRGAPVVGARLERARRAVAPERPPAGGARARPPRRAGVPGPSCQPSPTTRPSRGHDGAHQRVRARPAPARPGQVARPGQPAQLGAATRTRRRSAHVGSAPARAASRA